MKLSWSTFQHFTGRPLKIKAAGCRKQLKELRTYSPEVFYSVHARPCRRKKQRQKKTRLRACDRFEVFSVPI